MFIKPKGLILLFIFFLIFFTIGLFVGFKFPPLNQNNLIKDRISYDSFTDTNEFPNIISNEVDSLINKDSIISFDSVNNIDSGISLIDDSTEYIYDNIDTVLYSEDTVSDQVDEIIDTVINIETVDNDTSDFIDTVDSSLESIDTVDSSLESIDTVFTIEIYDTFIDTIKDSVEQIINPLDTLDEF